MRTHLQRASKRAPTSYSWPLASRSLWPKPRVIGIGPWDHKDLEAKGQLYHVGARFEALFKGVFQRCVQFRVESTLTHSTQFSFELTLELIFECATFWMPIHWAEWGFIGLVRTIPFNSHSRIDSLLSKSSHGWECECAWMAFELDTTLLIVGKFPS